MGTPSKEDGTPACDHLVTATTGRRPRAVVILFGWMGAEMAELERYSQMYHSRRCATVCATASPFSVITNDFSSIGEIAITACREAARLLRIAEMSEMGYGNVPLFIHAFSNGGAFVVEELERRIHEVVSESDLRAMRLACKEKQAELSDRETKAEAMQSWRSMRSVRDLGAMMREMGDNDEDSTEASCPGRVAVSGSTDASHDAMRTPTPVLRPYLPPPTPVNFTNPGGLVCGINDSGGSGNSSKSRRRRKSSSPKVRRYDAERTAQNASSAFRPSYNPEDRAYRQDLKLIAERIQMGCVLFDSAPCYLTMDSGLSATEHGIKSPFFQAIAKGAFLGSYGLSHVGTMFSCFSGTAGSSGRPAKFWRNMHRLSLSNNVVYAYSESDSLCNTAALRELIKGQKGRGKDVSVWKFDGSGHVQHLELNESQYDTMVDEMLDKLAPRKEGFDIDDDWSTSSEEERRRENGSAYTTPSR